MITWSVVIIDVDKTGFRILNNNVLNNVECETALSLGKLSSQENMSNDLRSHSVR
jgi:hypothetical protein